jgi:hypothetical protein
VPRRAAAAAVLALLIVACGSGQRSASGIVISVAGSSPAEISTFTLRTDEGELLDFEIGTLQTGGQSFPAAHLREHQASASPIEVLYRVEDGRRIALRLSDPAH